MAAQILLTTLLCFAIILLARNAKSGDVCTWFRFKWGIGINIDRCQLGNLTVEQGAFSCIEKCDQMPEVGKFNSWIEIDEFYKMTKILTRSVGLVSR